MQLTTTIAWRVLIQIRICIPGILLRSADVERSKQNIVPEHVEHFLVLHLGIINVSVSISHSFINLRSLLRWVTASPDNGIKTLDGQCKGYAASKVYLNHRHRSYTTAMRVVTLRLS